MRCLKPIKRCTLFSFSLTADSAEPLPRCLGHNPDPLTLPDQSAIADQQGLHTSQRSTMTRALHEPPRRLAWPPELMAPGKALERCAPLTSRRQAKA